MRLARLPCPSALPPLFMPMRPATGPLTTIIGPEKYVVASRPCMLNSSVQAASTAASTTGRYSGRQPAMTALTATFSTVHSTRSGGTTVTTSSGSRVVPSSIRSTRASVGGTTGSPSVQPRSKRASNSSSRAASSMRRLRSTLPLKRTASSSARFGSTLSEPHPGRHGGQVGAQAVHAGEGLPLLAVPAHRATGLLAGLEPQEGGHGVEVVVPGEVEVGVVDHPVDPLGKGGVVLAEHDEVGAPGEVGQHGRHQHAGRAVPLDHRDQPVGHDRPPRTGVHLGVPHRADRSPRSGRVEAALFPAGHGGG